MKISIKNEQEIELMRKSGQISYGLLTSLKKYIKPGMTTKQIDKYAHDYIIGHGATPAFLGYEGYPASTCISLNSMVVHGIPDNTKVLEGDIVSIDTGSIYKGYYSDTAYTFIVGKVDDKTKKLVEDTEKALYAGISKIKEGVSLNEVCKAIVGRTLHEDPYIPNLSNHESEGIILKAGMTLAIEPMFSLGTKEVWLLPDEWGIVTRDGSMAAHFEHTVLVTKDGYEILTGEMKNG